MNRFTFTLKLALLLITALATIGTATTASADWPHDRPIHLVVPFPPGSSPDLLARSIAEPLGNALAQVVIVENKVGAGGNIGTRSVAKAAADGYTLLYTINGPLVTAPKLFKTKLGYEPSTDLAPVMLVASSPNILVVPKSLPANNLTEFIQQAKGHVGQMNYGSVGNGSASHLAMEMFMQAAGIELNNINYPGFNQITLAMLAGDIQAGFMVPSGVMTQINEGKLKALAISSKTRNDLLPSLEPIAGMGYPNFEVISWNALLAPAGTSREIIDRLNRSLTEILAQDAIRNKFKLQYFTVVGSSPEKLAEQMRSERVKSEALIDQLKLSLD